jgi:O-antigen/teichoic acid export membrane protein
MDEPRERQHDAAPAVRSDTLADGILILLTFTIVQRSVGFVRSVLFCRWLEPEQLGEWDMAFGFLMLAAPLSVLALSSSFRRYVEHYRQQGLLRRFLGRTTAVYFLLGGASVAFILLARPWISTVVFGSPDRVELVTLMALTLAAIIAHHYFLDLFGALRSARLLAAIQMANGLLFALVGIVLLTVWRCDATSVVIAFGVACAACAMMGTVAVRRAWPALSDNADSRQPLSVWKKILPFVGWVSLANLMGAMFDVVDRYMIIHFSTFSPSEALAQVGLYHSCRVVPLLLVSVVAMAASIITPHLAHDWEAGRRDRVNMHMQMLLKLFGFGLTAACVCIIHGAPFLFGVAFQGKFNGAMEILPWTLAYCCWFALFALLQNYVWCCEKAYTATVALVIGVALNVCLNMLLLPRMGLFGAVLATASANIVALGILFCFCGQLGLKLERSTWVAVALPVSVCLGPWPATLVLAAIVLEAVTGTFLLNSEEKRGFAEGARRYLERVAMMASLVRGSHAR